MIEVNTIIIGGGPAGSTCAWKLNRAGREVLLLDKENFPRLKLCAGWITPKVVRDLRIDLNKYPHSLVKFDRLNCSFRGLKLPIKTRQYSIRRIEFDHWLLQRAQVKVIRHLAKKIAYKNGRFIIDNQFRSKYLVGAGGTYCPVYKTFFKYLNPRAAVQQIVALEEEFAYDYRNSNCYLWFFDDGLTGYSWYVPKNKGYINIGIGGKLAPLKQKHQSIHDHWHHFIQKLGRKSLIVNYQGNPKGYQYFLRQDVNVVQYENAYIVGDSIGLATKDMGEGIGPAIESGLLAADAIIHKREFSIDSVSKYSLPGILFPSRYDR